MLVPLATWPGRRVGIEFERIRSGPVRVACVRRREGPGRRDWKRQSVGCMRSAKRCGVTPGSTAVSEQGGGVDWLGAREFDLKVIAIRGSLRLLLVVSRDLRGPPTWNPRRLGAFRAVFSGSCHLAHTRERNRIVQRGLRRDAGGSQGSGTAILRLRCDSTYLVATLGRRNSRTITAERDSTLASSEAEFSVTKGPIPTPAPRLETGWLMTLYREVFCDHARKG